MPNAIKINYIKLVFITFVLLASCSKLDNPAVETYIYQLKTGKYKSPELPAFKPDDIPSLLQYRNETMIITDFPHNPISSLWGPECELGIYVLWTIESIRAVEIGSQYLIGRFPSQNPVLALRETGDLVSDEDSHLIADQAYLNWWYSAATRKNKMEVDPLENTKYKWH
jgi:hypothetical protein